MENVTDFKEIVQEIKEAGGEPTKYCYQCGKCDTVCPWNRVKQFSIRRLVREANFGLSEIENDDIWLCTTCGKCPKRCPRDVRQIQDVVAVRKIAAKYDVFAGSSSIIRTISSKLNQEGNPFGEDRKNRTAWAEGLSVKTYTEDLEYLYSPCCYLAYDPRLKKIAQATAGLLNAFGTTYGILGDRENCCGESIRKTGDEELFKKLAKSNIKNYIDNGVQKVLVSSPHCYHTLKNEYAQFKVNFEIVHVTQYLFQLLSEGKLRIRKDFDRKVAYHDPCYLGRHNEIFDEPREVIKAIPKLKLISMEEEREDSLCCGMGGGRVWMETQKEERFANIRIEQAVSAGAEVLVTACPYCVVSLEDARVVLNLEEKIEIMDITELLMQVI